YLAKPAIIKIISTESSDQITMSDNDIHCLGLHSSEHQAGPVDPNSASCAGERSTEFEWNVGGLVDHVTIDDAARCQVAISVDNRSIGVTGNLRVNSKWLRNRERRRNRIRERWHSFDLSERHRPDSGLKVERDCRRL